MILHHQAPLHLTYGLNVHPGERWEENLGAIRTFTLPIRDRVAPGGLFGLGLRLSRQAAETLSLPDALSGFRDFMAANHLYAFTLNGFPYGPFHGRPVKTEVYRPDWSTRERLDYTLMLARILAQLLPDNTEGSISTLPLGYASPTRDHASSRGIHQSVLNLADCALALHTLLLETGREIHIGLEPEPDCLLETTDDVIRFFEGPLRNHGVPRLASRLGCGHDTAETILRRHIGVCFDTCHLAIQFETLADSLARLVRHGIRLSKIQLSSALEARPDATARQRLEGFLDPVYLHQVKARPVSSLTPPPQTVIAYPDLPEALRSDTATGLWRIHFHLPLYYQGDGVLRSTSGTLDDAFWRTAKAAPVSHWEIETYTFSVLPPALQADGLIASIAREYEWVLHHAR